MTASSIRFPSTWPGSCFWTGRAHGFFLDWDEVADGTVGALLGPSEDALRRRALDADAGRP